MTITTTYERVEPTTAIGECFKVIQTYSSFDKSEIDEVEKFYTDVCKSATILEVNADEDSD